jgi:hypothetical protein
MNVMAVPQFERFFRAAAGLDIDKDDIKRLGDLLNAKLVDLLLVAQDAAGANGRDVIEFWDLPISKGLQERIHEFRRLDEQAELLPVLDELAARPQLDRALSDETEARIPEILGGLGVALARTFTVIDTRVRNPSSEHWERAARVFDLLL